MAAKRGPKKVEVWNYTRTDHTEVDTATEVERPTTLHELGELLTTHRQGRRFTLRSAGQAFHTQALPSRKPAKVGGMAENAIVFLEGLTGRYGDDLQQRDADAEGAFVGLDPGRKEVAVDAPPTIEVAGWVTWGRIFDALITNDRLPYVHVTSKRVSVAGSINADGLSRSSSLYGKEADTLVWVDLLVARQPVGQATAEAHRRAGASAYTIYRVWHPASWKHRAAPPADRERPPDEATNARWFHAITGGIGMLGVVVRAKYVVMPVDDSRRGSVYVSRDHSGPFSARATGNHVIRAFSRVTTYDDHGSFFDGLAQLANRSLAVVTSTKEDFRTLPAHWEKALQTHLGASITNLGPSENWPKDPSRLKQRAAVVSVSHAWTPRDVSRFILWDRPTATSTYIALIPALPLDFNAGDTFLWKRLEEGAAASNPAGLPFIDPICDYSFFFEAHSDSRDALEKRYTPTSTQQSFSIPIAPASGRTGFDVSRVLEFYVEARRIFHLGNAYPQATDVLFLPAVHGVLSPNRDLHALTISFAFEAVIGGRADLIRRALRKVSKVCADLGGRVHLGKNVYVEPSDLARMYGSSLKEFREIKAELDPDGVFTSAFWEEVVLPAEALDGQYVLPPPGPSVPPGAPTAGWDPVTQGDVSDTFFGELRPFDRDTWLEGIDGKTATDLQAKPMPCQDT